MKKTCHFCGCELEAKELILPYTETSKKNHKYEFFSCCAYIKQEKFLTKKELATLYSSNYIVFKKNLLKDALNVFLTEHRIKKYKSHIKGKDVLELGSGMGEFLLRAYEVKPHSVTGVEGSKFATEHIAKENQKITIINSDIETFSSNKKFDSIFMFHVIEHVKDPELLISNCYKMLKKEGVLIMETPNFSSLERLIFKNNWFNYSVPYHTYVYSPKTLRLIGKNAGFCSATVNFPHFPNTLMSQFKQFHPLFLPLIWAFYIPSYFIASIFGKTGVFGIILKK
jgi:2-polyprenyl-3-methyl-5-hydroxy-6-metoxy-1,4-benzoquinol methylase